MITDYVNMTEEDINRFQNGLDLLLTLARIHYGELGTLIGVSRQTIMNLCKGDIKMRKTQYIAINVMLDYKLGEEYKKLLEIVYSMKGL